MSTSNYSVYYDSEAVKTLKELQDIKIEKKKSFLVEGYNRSKKILNSLKKKKKKKKKCEFIMLRFKLSFILKLSH